MEAELKSCDEENKKAPGWHKIIYKLLYSLKGVLLMLGLHQTIFTVPD